VYSTLDAASGVEGGASVSHFFRGWLQATHVDIALALINAVPEEAFAATDEEGNDQASMGGGCIEGSTQVINVGKMRRRHRSVKISVFAMMVSPLLGYFCLSKFAGAFFLPVLVNFPPTAYALLVPNRGHCSLQVTATLE